MDTADMNYIVKTEGFTVAVAAQKNRVYCTLEAVNAALPKFSEISDAWLEVGSYLTDRFTLVLDAGIEKIQHPALIGFLLDIQKTAADGGVHKIAEVISGSDFAYRLHAQIAEMAGTTTRRQVFADRKEAEHWLDSLPPYI